MYIKEKNNYKTVSDIYVKIDNTYKKVIKGFVKENGAYKVFHSPNSSDNPNYSTDFVFIMAIGEQINNVTVTLYDYKPTSSLLWKHRVDSGTFTIGGDITSDNITISNNQNTAIGAIWCEIDGVSLGEIPINIQYSNGG